MSEKTLIIYYSRSGKSEILAKDLQSKIGCDMDKIEYATKNHISFFGAGFEAVSKKTVKIKGANHSPGDYEKIIFITPIWASALSTPVRSYMAENKANIKSYSLIATCGSSGLEGTIKDAGNIMQKEPDNSEMYRSAQIAKGDYDLGKFT